jgi:phospholipid transport system substrate-binding protein
MTMLPSRSRFLSLLAAPFVAAPVVALAVLCAAGPVAAQAVAEAPDAVIKKAVAEVAAAISADRDIQAGNRPKIVALIESRVLPHLDMAAMTRSAAGRHWPRATPEQQRALTAEFSRLLINTYAGAFSAYRPDTAIDFRPARLDDGGNAASVRSTVTARGGEPMQIDYFLEKGAAGWKVIDINVLGARLVETYKNQFNGAITANGMDGLIKTLAERNKAIEARGRS